MNRALSEDVAKHSKSKDEMGTRVDDDNEWYYGLSEWEIHLEGEIKKRERGALPQLISV